MKRGKKYTKLAKDIKKKPSYSMEEGIKVAKQYSYSKFVGTLELHATVKVPKDRDAKSLKGALSLPHSSEKKDVRIAVLCTPDMDSKAKEAGADFVGIDEIVKSVKAGKIEFDVVIATPAVMPKIAILGKELGPKGLMPSPKNGTVTDDIVSAISEYKKGKQTFACDASGVMHIAVGKLDLDDEKLLENIKVAINAIAEVIGKSPELSIKSMHLCPTMGQSVKVTL